MKAATEKKVKAIRDRAKDLKACYIREVRALSNKDAKAEDSEVPRVSGMVVREGRWLGKIANKFVERHNLKISEKETKVILESGEFFDSLYGIHEDQVSKNDFIFRLPSEFILHLERLAALVLKFDADAKQRIAAVHSEEAGDDEAIEDEINAEMIS